MITYEAAKRIALDYSPEVNCVREYEKAFVFSIDDGIEKDGGPHFAMMKEDGRTKPFVDFIFEDKPEKTTPPARKF